MSLAVIKPLPLLWVFGRAMIYSIIDVPTYSTTANSSSRVQGV